MMKLRFVLFGLLTAFILLPIGIAAAHGNEPADSVAVETVANNNVPLIFMALGIGIVAAIGRQNVAKPKLKLTQLGVVCLGIITAILHLIAGLDGEILLLLNGFGYLVLLALLYLPFGELVPRNLRQPLRWTILIYTIVTLVGYFVSHPIGAYDGFGLATKFVEILLILILGMRIQRAPAEEALLQSRRTASGRGRSQAAAD